MCRTRKGTELGRDKKRKVLPTSEAMHINFAMEYKELLPIFQMKVKCNKKRGHDQ
jgi:hypothetical protein